MTEQSAGNDLCLNCEAFAGLEATVREAYLNAFPIAATGLNSILVALAAIRLLYLIALFIKGSGTSMHAGNFMVELIVFSFVSGMLYQFLKRLTR